MPTDVDIANRALISLGKPKKLTSLQQDSLEAQAALSIIYQLRDDLLRMAPWDCALKFANLTYITSVAGTPENTSAGTTLWQPGVPAPPWAYEYQYPVDCLRACWIIPQFQTGFSGGIPITTAVTGGASAWWQGPPAKFKVSIDQFYMASGATVNTAGVNYALGDILNLEVPDPSNPTKWAPAQLMVTGIDGSGGVTSVQMVNQILGTLPSAGGSYFKIPSLTVISVSSVLGVGGRDTSTALGAVVDVTFYTAQFSQRVILTNQEFATLAYVKQITDPNVLDPLFIDAWTAILASRLIMILDENKEEAKSFANIKIVEANNYIIEARKVDGNEGITVNNVTPDWIRFRGIDFSDGLNNGPYSDFDWGGSFPMYG